MVYNYNYWAKFIYIEKYLFRFDTRIYLEPVNEVNNNDQCIGAVVGKNPGSAKQSKCISNDIQPLELDGDQLLPNVKSIVKKSYEKVKVTIPEKEYIQVLNLFYLCDKNLEKATKNFEQIKQHGNIRYNCDTENQSFNWIWYVWGGKNKNQTIDSLLNSLKERFRNLNSANHFYYAPKQSKIIYKVPSKSDFARHTQGLKHEFVIPHISGLINNKNL